MCVRTLGRALTTYMRLLQALPSTENAAIMQPVAVQHGASCQREPDRRSLFREGARSSLYTYYILQPFFLINDRISNNSYIKFCPPPLSLPRMENHDRVAGDLILFISIE